MGLLLNKWSFQLVDVTQSYAQTSLDDDTGKVMVLTEDTPDSPTIYTDENGTTLTETGGIGVLTITNGRVSFFTAATVTAVDLSGITADGRAIGLNSVSSSVGRILVNPMGSRQTVAVPFGPNNNSEQDTGLDLPANCLMTAYNVSLRVTTADATETIDVGLLSGEAGGDANGFITVGDVGTTGWRELLPQITGGTTIDYVGTRYIGDLLATSITGADAVATVGGFTSKRYRTDGTAKSISYTGSAGSDTAAGYVYLSWERLPF
jgi:hypothetical protein